jgi:CHAD domain-containing protein
MDRITHHLRKVYEGLRNTIEFFLEYRADESHWAKIEVIGE